MPKLINITPRFNPVNNAYYYLAIAEDDTQWVRSTKGNWAQVTQKPATFDSVKADFELYMQGHLPITETTLIQENASLQIAVVPTVPATPIEV